MILSRMVKACRECKYRDTCENKKMEGFASLPEPMMATASAALTEPRAAEILVKHDYREVYIDKNTRTTIDLEEVKRELAREIYKPHADWLMRGGA